MIGFLSKLGEIWSSPMPATPGPQFSEILDVAIAAEGSNDSSFARLLGWSPSTFANYLHRSVNRTSPPVQELFDRVERMPLVLRLMLANEFCPEGYQLVPVAESDEVAAHGVAAAPIDAFVTADSALLHVKTLYARHAADHHIDGAERAEGRSAVVAALATAHRKLIALWRGGRVRS